MEIPENLRVLVDQLGQAMVQALVNNPESRELARQIQTEGFDIALMLEATIALRQRKETGEAGEALQGELPEEGLEPKSGTEPFLRPLLRMPDAFGEVSRSSSISEWSEADKAFLKTFNISLE